MTELSKKIDLLTQFFSDEENELFIKNRFPYIMTKADSYLTKGPAAFRKDDGFNMPLKEWSKADLELIRDGCSQIMAGVGFMAKKPFKKLGVRGFYLLFETFHFKNNGRKSKYLRPEIILDEIVLRHIVDNSVVKYYNLVERSSL